MYASECRSFSDAETGCSTHGQVDCLCDVTPLARGVPIRSIPNSDRLVELGLSRHSFVTWAEELMARENGLGHLRVAADAG
jgi:hypothetical protein